MPLADPSVERVSACPVHFIWDGRGKGRALVRAGFLGFLAAAMLGTLGKMMHVELSTNAGLAVAVAALAVWLAGQGASFLAVRALRSRA